MGINTSLFTFTGKVGGFIGYRRNGKYCLRSAPEKVRQTQATRQAAQWFGAASRKAALIRSGIAPDLDIYPDGGHVNRLNKNIVRAGRNNHGCVEGFRFNGYSSVKTYFVSGMEFTPDGKLHIPAQDLNVRKDCVRMEVKLIGTRIDFVSRKVTGSDASVMYIDLEHPYPYFTGGDLSIDVPGKGTLLVTVQVRLYLAECVSLNRKYCAADIIAVLDDQAAKVIPAKAKPHPQPSTSLSSPPDLSAPQSEGLIFIQRE